MSIVRSVGTLITCHECGHKWKNKYKTIKKCPLCKSYNFSHPTTQYIPDEIWKMSKLLPNYEVSNYGRIRRAVPGMGTYVGRIFNGSINDDGYLRHNSLFTHLIVSHEFIGQKPEGCECNHKDGNKMNNNVSNLEYVTHAENMNHAKKNNLMSFGERSGACKLLESDVLSILLLKDSGVNNPTLAKIFNIDQSCISRIVNGHTWKRTVEKYANQSV